MEPLLPFPIDWNSSREHLACSGMIVVRSMEDVEDVGGKLKVSQDWIESGATCPSHEVHQRLWVGLVGVSHDPLEAKKLGVNPDKGGVSCSTFGRNPGSRVEVAVME